MTRTPIFDELLAEHAPPWLRDALTPTPDPERAAGELPMPAGSQATTN